jgi:peptidoglycan/LPS O-acetylase OafA/YrhL
VAPPPSCSATPWSTAAAQAAATPDSRDRYVDFLRAASILAVITGHWLAAAPHFDAQRTLIHTHALAIGSWTHWLTWGFQVMPIFFMVGGFSNGVSWRAARRDGKSYAIWLDGRLRRLVLPIAPLFVAWTGIVTIEGLRGVGALRHALILGPGARGRCGSPRMHSC